MYVAKHTSQKQEKNVYFILQALQILACTAAYIIENNMQISTHRTGFHDILPKAYKRLVKQASYKIKEQSECDWNHKTIFVNTQQNTEVVH